MSKAYFIHARNNRERDMVKTFLADNPDLRFEEKKVEYPWTVREIHNKVTDKANECFDRGAGIMSSGVSNSGEYHVLILDSSKKHYKFGKARLRKGEDYDSGIGYALAMCRAMGWQNLEQLMLEAIEREEGSVK